MDNIDPESTRNFTQEEYRCPVERSALPRSALKDSHPHDVLRKRLIAGYTT